MGDDGFLKPKAGFATQAIHVGHDPDKFGYGSVVLPIFNTSTFKQIAPAENLGYDYGRSGNPTRNCLEECLAALDGGTDAMAYASGLGATTTVVSLLSSGDHIVSIDDVYGGTNRLFRRVVDRLGIKTSFVNFTDLNDISEAIQENTKMIWIETPTNPILKVVDIAAIAKLAKSRGNIIVVVDNTFLTPYLQRPLDFGADIVVYSVTKYLNGHSDVIMGAAVVKDADLAERLRFLQMAMGVVPSPMDCFLVNRSLKTLALRMERHKKSSLHIAKWLQKHPKVTEVMHPGLPTHPQHELAKRQTSGHSGVFSFRHIGGLKESKKFLDTVKIFILAESLGGYESLAELPSLMTHASVPEHQRAELGISDSLIRLSIGLEDTEDLMEDIDQALKAAFE
ncbi:cystathionine gamma-lyase [Epargyreus clarus]|uniref:cystathionine gamma-lyase n=1 Tax=Epargyreus clarus TaxID=520877 RepID=UPI003C2F11BC